MPSSFQELTVLSIQFRLVAEESFIGYPILGSTLRGAFGNGLKLAACTVDHQDCGRCLLKSACHYTNIFESVNDDNAPRPFVFDIPAPPLNPRLSVDDSLRIRIPRGAELPFGITIIGADAIKRLPFFIAGVANLAEHGIGMPRRRFRLISVYSDNNVILGDGGVEDSRLKVNTLSELCDLRMATLDVDERITIRMMTPTWMRKNRETVERPSFFDFIKFNLQRLSNIFTYYAESPLDIDAKFYLDAARGIDTVNETIWRHDFEFYSNRRNQREGHSGILGEMIFVGKNMKMFLPLLIAGEILHIGSKTTFGLGRYRIADKLAGV